MIIVEVRDYMSKVHLADESVIKVLKKFMYIENDFWMRRSNPNIPRYKFLITDSGAFLTGLLPRVSAVLKKYKVDFEIVDKRSIRTSPDIKDVKTFLKGMRVEGKRLKLRDYQLDSLVRGLQKTRGVYDLCTGAGKSVVMSALITSWRRRTLVVVNSTSLAEQLRDDIAEFTQEPVGFIGSGIWDPKDVTVAIDRSLVSGRSRKRKKRAKEFLESIEYLIFDEVHHIQSKTWQNISAACEFASIRHGFSGTPETSSYKTESGEGNQDEVMEAHLGTVIHRITVGELIEKGWLSRPIVNIIQNEVYFDSNPLDYNEEYERIIVKDEMRNRMITNIMHAAAQEEKQTIGFVTRIAHGEILVDSLIHEYGLPEDAVKFVHGDGYDRKGDIADFKQGATPILIGTVLNEGLNFFSHNGINCAAGKSSKQVRQKIGRILRKPRTETGDVDRESERVVNFWDFADGGHVWYYKHGRRRIRTYRADGHEVVRVDPDDILK